MIFFMTKLIYRLKLRIDFSFVGCYNDRIKNNGDLYENKSLAN